MEDWGALGAYWAPAAAYCPPWRYCCGGYPCGARESAPVGKGLTTSHSPHQRGTHLVGVRPLEALAGQLLALGRSRVGVLRHSLPTIEGASPRRPHWAHAHRGDTRRGHNTCHASWAHAVGATGSSMGQELAAERLPCAHLQQQREKGHSRPGGLSAPQFCHIQVLTAPYWLSSWLCFSCSAATVAVAVAVAVAAAAATAAAAAAWVKSAVARLACEGSPIPPGPLGPPL